LSVISITSVHLYFYASQLIDCDDVFSGLGLSSYVVRTSKRYTIMNHFEHT